MAKRARPDVVCIDCDAPPDPIPEDTPPEIQEMFYGWILHKLVVGISGFAFAAAVYNEFSVFRSLSKEFMDLVHRCLTPVLHSLYSSKVSITGLSIREANSLLDMMPYYKEDVEASWALYTLVTYYERKALHTMDKFPVHAHLITQINYFKDRDTIGKHFCMGGTPSQTVPFSNVQGLYLVEGISRRPYKYKAQMERYIASFDDEDTRARLKQLLMKCNMEESKGYFFEQLLTLHDPETLEEADKERLTRIKAFPFSLRRLHSTKPDESDARVTSLAFRLKSGDYRHFPTSRHPEVMELKESMFRLRGTSLAEAKTVHRLHIAEEEMRYRRKRLVEGVPTIITIL